MAVPIRSIHRMPFGAEVQNDGSMRFRLWAPSVTDAKLLLETPGTEIIHPMKSLDNGFFELITTEAHPGDSYWYLINDDLKVPDPASRFNPSDVHGPSLIVDPGCFDWTDSDWTGRPWREAVIYELHVGTFTPEGTFRAVKQNLDYLVNLGVTAIELMPVADFPGRRNWGYDGALLFAPDSVYGAPDDLKDLIQNCHHKGMMVFLDVVYNHFGPDGNYLYSYAKEFFTDRYHTPWGNAINFEGACSRTVRDFFIHNALYWLEEFHLDGLRLDAVHAIIDHSQPEIIEELAEAVRSGPGRDRQCHLVLENVDNKAGYLRQYDAQWNDDWHHAMHVLLTEEKDGYYSDYIDKPVWHLGRCLAEGFAYQGEISNFHGGIARGEPSSDLPITAFLSFLQNHDQVGNRAFGERLHLLTSAAAQKAAIAVLLLAPSPPMLFMGEEFASSSPFLYFCDHKKELAEAVTIGRRSEFARFRQFATPESQAKIPDPSDLKTFQKSKLDWENVEKPDSKERLDLYRRLLAIRKSRIVPLLSEFRDASFEVLRESGLMVDWILAHGARLHLAANLGKDSLMNLPVPPGEIIYATPEISNEAPAWSVVWSLEE
jgi:malto-oligosyltrehalose trehalohydrolase